MFDKFTDDEFQQFRDLIYNESGIHFTNTNRPILESRLKDRLKKIKIETIEGYYKLITSDAKELRNLLDLITTNLTRFFRTESQFESLENHIVDDLKQKKTNKNLKIWSAGCSTGEEPYSIAMVLKEKLDNSWNIQIIASDISFNALMKAKEGFYDQARVVGIPEKYLKKYMIEIGNGYYVKDDIKNLIQFDYHNLKNPTSFNNFDIIFCRNVIIYFDTKAQKRVVKYFYEVMNDYSYLFIGHSESLFGMDTKFLFTKIGNACLYMKKEGKYAE